MRAAGVAMFSELVARYCRRGGLLSKPKAGLWSVALECVGQVRGPMNFVIPPTRLHICGHPDPGTRNFARTLGTFLHQFDVNQQESTR